MSLDSSLTSGGPPLLSLQDSDTSPPGNFDDDQVMLEDSAPESTSDYTQTTIAIALRQMLPQRLAVTRFLNNPTSIGSYQETLRLDAYLRTAYRVLRHTLQMCHDVTSEAMMSRSELVLVDFIMQRWPTALHVPYLALAIHEAKYAFSHKVVLETSSKTWRAVCSPTSSARPQACFADKYDDLRRLTICTSGFYSTVTIHAALLVIIELRSQIQEDEGLQPVYLRPDLLGVLTEAQAWCLQAIKPGETNIKAYLLIRVVTAYVEGLMHGLNHNAIAAKLDRVVEAVEDTCYPVLESTAAAQRHGEDKMSETREGPAYAPIEDLENDFLVPLDSTYDLDDSQSMTWLFNDGFI